MDSLTDDKEAAVRTLILECTTSAEQKHTDQSQPYVFLATRLRWALALPSMMR